MRNKGEQKAYLLQLDKKYSFFWQGSYSVKQNLQMHTFASTEGNTMHFPQMEKK